MSLEIEYYKDGMEQKWDNFVLNESMNGTFLQARKFINYHKDGKFKDCSLCIRKGNELVATIMACNIDDEGKKTFFAHKGSTYGGITISPKIYNASSIDELFHVLDVFWKTEGFEKIYLKMVPPIYQKTNTDLVDYFLYKEGFTCYDELNYYMNLDRYREDVIDQFSKNKRRDYRYSLKNNLKFKLLTSSKEIQEFYDILQLNLKKLNLTSVHSYEDLIDLKFNRFNEEIEFYGVYLEDKMIAGSMIFIFDGHIFHTQYLSSNEEYLKLFPMDFLICNLIETAICKEIDTFTFGICTEDRGRNLNLGLSRFKEGFGTEYCINRSYEKAMELSR